MKTRYRSLLGFALILVLLLSGMGLWLHKEQKQYALNRQLIEALTHFDTNQALALVKAGADPNTRLDPPPAPSLQLLLDQLLHRTPLVNKSSTALLLACGVTWLPPSPIVVQLTVSFGIRKFDWGAHCTGIFSTTPPLSFGIRKPFAHCTGKPALA